MRTLGVLLAGGAGRRMGTPKALLRDLDGTPFLARAIGILLEGGCDRVVVVTGAAADQAGTLLDETGWTLIQQQALAGEHEHELIFQARAEDFQGPSTDEILKDVGLSPSDVKELLEGDR